MEHQISKRATPAYSRFAREAVRLLGHQIRLARLEAKMTAQSVAERAGISRGTLQRIEDGEMGAQIGTVFEVAVIVGVPLFANDVHAVARERRRVDDRLALLPSRARPSRKPSDDF